MGVQARKGELRTIGMLQYFASHLSHAVDQFNVLWLSSSDLQGEFEKKKGGRVKAGKTYHLS